MKELEEWVENISFIQNKLLQLLGYKIRQRKPIYDHPYLDLVVETAEEKDRHQVITSQNKKQIVFERGSLNYDNLAQLINLRFSENAPSRIILEYDTEEKK